MTEENGILELLRQHGGLLSDMREQNDENHRELRTLLNGKADKDDLDALEARVGDAEIVQTEFKTKMKVLWGMFTASLFAGASATAGWLGFK